MVSQIVHIEYPECIESDQPLSDRPGHLVVEALPDHAERQSVQLAIVRSRAEAAENPRQSLKLRPNRLPNQNVGCQGRVEHLPQEEPVPPVVGIIDRQNAAKEVVNEVAQLIRLVE